ncbi:MAG: hypothetical protein Q7N50_05740 [Armatimonadota bacterium]|nr:hypothetical protein [Armatimonadota bacterium]
MRWLLNSILSLLILASWPQLSGAVVLVDEDFNSWAKVPGPGWQMSAKPGGTVELVADEMGGKAVKASSPLNGSSYISRSLGGSYSELYVSLRVKIVSFNQGNTIEQQRDKGNILLLLGEADGRTRWRTSLTLESSHHDLLMTLFTSQMGLHKTGPTWSRGETLDIGFGIKYGKQGFLKFYYGGAKTYEINYDTTAPNLPNSISDLRIGAHDGAGLAVVIDNARVATSEDEAGVLAKVDLSPSPLVISVDSQKVLRPVNFDCFGVGAGSPSDQTPYSNLKAATLPMGFTSVRWMPGGAYGGLDWDADEDVPGLSSRPFYFKERDSSSRLGKNGRSFEEHLDYFGADPQLVCVTGGDYTGKKLDGPNGWVHYNEKRGRRDCIYEIGNECELTQRPQDCYVFTGDKWDQICNGVIRWPPPGPQRIEQSLLHYGGEKDPDYDYTFPLNNKGAAVYLGFGYRWDGCRIKLARAGVGDAKLGWAIWTGTGWEIVHDGRPGGKSYLMTQHGKIDDLRDIRNLTASTANAYWSDSFHLPGGPFERWKRTSARALSGGSIQSDKELYYVKIWTLSGSYTGGEPREGQISLGIATPEYLAVGRTYAEVIRKNGGTAFASSATLDIRPGWLDMLERLAPAIDGLAFHSYPSTSVDWGIPEWRRIGQSTYTTALYDVEWMRKMAEELRARKAFTGKKLALTEWNSGGAEYIGGLSTAIALCEILKGGWDSAQRYSWLTLWQHRNLSDSVASDSGLLASKSPKKDTEFFERPSATAFKLIRHTAKSNLIQAKCYYKGPNGARDYSGVYVCGFEGASKTDKALMIVNRTDIDLPGIPIQWKSAAGLKFRVVALESTAGVHGNNEGDKPQVGVVGKPAITFSRTGEARITLPAYSLYVLEVLR